MKSKLKYLLLIMCTSINTVFLTYADDSIFGTEKRMDKQMLEAVLVFLRTCSWFVFALALGLFISAYTSADGAKKANALKLFGVFIVLYGLKTVASLSGLI